MKPWETRSRRTLLDLGPWLRLESHEVVLPDGRVIDDWSWVAIRDYVNVVAVTETGRFLAFRQTKYAVDGTTVAPVGGHLERDEDPLLAARRELLEETGHETDEWTPLGVYAVDGNRGVGVWASHVLHEPGRRRGGATPQPQRGTGARGKGSASGALLAIASRVPHSA